MAARAAHRACVAPLASRCAREAERWLTPSHALSAATAEKLGAPDRRGRPTVTRLAMTPVAVMTARTGHGGRLLHLKLWKSSLKPNLFTSVGAHFPNMTRAAEPHFY